MFDEHYFTTMLGRDVEATGGHPIVEVQLISGHVHRVRAIIETSTGSVTFDAYHAKGDLAHERPRFGEADSHGAPRATFRAVVAYESIVAVILDPSQEQVRARPGFATG